MLCLLIQHVSSFPFHWLCIFTNVVSTVVGMPDFILFFYFTSQILWSVYIQYIANYSLSWAYHCYIWQLIHFHVVYYKIGHGQLYNSSDNPCGYLYCCHKKLVSFFNCSSTSYSFLDMHKLLVHYDNYFIYVVWFTFIVDWSNKKNMLCYVVMLLN